MKNRTQWGRLASGWTCCVRHIRCIGCAAAKYSTRVRDYGSSQEGRDYRCPQRMMADRVPPPGDALLFLSWRVGHAGQLIGLAPGPQVRCLLDGLDRSSSACRTIGDVRDDATLARLGSQCSMLSTKDHARIPLEASICVRGQGAVLKLFQIPPPTYA